MFVRLALQLRMVVVVGVGGIKTICNSCVLKIGIFYAF